jgi:hypothetical protein
MAITGHAMAIDKVLVELPMRVKTATGVRSALIQSSLTAVERLGLTDRYFANLSEADAASIRQLVVGEWNPMALGVAHYGAIDKLGLSAAQAKQNGRVVAEKVQVGFANIVFRGIGTAITPLDAVKRAPTFFARLIDGGAVGVVQRGPKDVRLEIVEIPLGQFTYVREGWCGMFEATLGLLTHKTFVRNSSPRGGDRVVLDISWV